MLENSQPWIVPGYLEVRDGHLTIDGADAVRMAEQYGTPLYVFSERRIAENISALRGRIEPIHPRIKLCYAAKANSNMSVLRAVLAAGGDIEVNSGGELFKAKKIGFRPDQIVFNGVSKTDHEICDAIEYGVLAINVDSLYELDQVARCARAARRRANIAIRVVPEIITGSHIGLQTGLLSSKFGISPSLISEALDRALASSDALQLVGLHIHIGSQTPDARPFARAFAEMWRLALELYQETGHRIQHINMGGGLPVNYLPDANAALEINPQERAILSARLDPAEVMRAAIEEIMPLGPDGQKLLEGLTIVLEPGRSIIADAGLLLTRVCNIKVRPETGDTWLLTDAGYSLMPSMAIYKWYYHLISASRASDPHSAPYKVAGPLCDSGDVYFDLEGGSRLPNYRLLPEGTSVGDVLALLNAGAYTLDQASQYNGRPRPAAVIVKRNGEVALARRRENYEDLINMDSW